MKEVADSAHANRSRAVKKGSKPLDSWMEQCLALLNKLRSVEVNGYNIAAPFLFPVDTTIYDDYLQFIKQPMDLGEVEVSFINKSKEMMNIFRVVILGSPLLPPYIPPNSQ